LPGFLYIAQDLLLSTEHKICIEKKRMTKGFTLAELLIALAILGVIATFTIPKVLNSQQDTKYKAIAKETAATISAAYQAYQQQNTPMASTKIDDFAPYLNYVKLDTSSGMWVDDTPGNSPWPCSNSERCIKLHNGAILGYNLSETFAGTSANNFIRLWVDPDGGTNNGNASGAYQAVQFNLYFNGRLSSRGLDPNTPGSDPPWFSWN
jgi:prepilin-type N-terminal cleavage/methylation domain-containing protein